MAKKRLTIVISGITQTCMENWKYGNSR